MPWVVQSVWGWRCRCSSKQRIVEDVDVDQVAVELYGLAPDDFTAARNEAARAATNGGDTRTAEAIKALRKPTLASWLANQLVRANPDGVHQLTELGEQLRQAHLSADGPALRRLTPQRHELVRSLVTTARDKARAEGRTITAAVAERLTETLDAALVDPGAAQLLRTGQLISALRHVGFGVVDESGDPAKLAPVKPRVVRRARPAPARKSTAAPRPPRQDPLQQRRAELAARADQTATDYDEAEAERAEAESLLDANQHHVSDLEATIERLTEELEQARDRLKAVRREAPRLQRNLERATRTAAAAQRRRDGAAEQLARFSS
jgi:DNA repair exonuclease SbcCD ATPase subunit